MKKIIHILSLVFLWLLCVFGCPACAYNGTSSVTISLINSRSPALINAGGTNDVSASNGYSGGGHLEADVPVSAIP
jgi:hypothetical protein